MVQSAYASFVEVNPAGAGLSKPGKASATTSLRVSCARTRSQTRWVSGTPCTSTAVFPFSLVMSCILRWSCTCGIGLDGSGPGARVGGPRQCLRVDILPDVSHFAISNGNVEDPIVLERLIRGFDFPRSDADDQNPVSLRHELGGRWVCRFYLFGRLLKHSRQFRVPAVRAGQRPALARNDPLNICGNQREQILFIVGTYCCKEIFHNLNI